jgi:hypothetical protein
LRLGQAGEVEPRLINVDGHPASHAAMAELQESLLSTSAICCMTAIQSSVRDSDPLCAPEAWSL